MAKKGKYADIVDALPRLPARDEEDTKYQDKINARKAQIINGDPLNDLAPEPRHASHLAIRVAECRELRDKLTAELKAANLELLAYFQLMDDQFEAEGITSIKFEDGGSVRIQREPYADIEDADKLRQWYIKEGLERELSVQWNKANSMMKHLLLEGQEPPAGIKAYFRPKLFYSR